MGEREGVVKKVARKRSGFWASHEEEEEEGVLHEVDAQRRYFVRGLGCWGFRLVWVWAVGIRQGCSLSPAGVANLHASVHVHILMYLHARIHMHTPTHI